MNVRRIFSLLSIACLGVLSNHCGSSTSDGASADAGSDANDAQADSGDCGPVPGGWDCVNPCTQQMHGPVCLNGSWTCNDPDPSECPDAGDAGVDSGCAPAGNAVPVSCEPFPENTTCDPVGLWSLAYETEYPGMCVQPAIGSVSIERGSDGIVRVAYGSTASATLTLDGCELGVVSVEDWTNPSESGTVTHSLTLSFAADAADTASGQLTYSETGLCSGSGTTSATATRVTN